MSLRLTRSVQASGFSSSLTVNLEAESEINDKVTMSAAKTGTLTTRTDANTGTLTMTAGHGITTGAVVDIYWDGGSRHAVVVGTVATNSVPIDLGAGDDLPAATTAVTVQVVNPMALPFVGDNLVAVVFSCGQYGPAQFTVYAADGTTILLNKTVQASSFYSWDEESDADNPFEGVTAATIKVSQGSSSGSSVLRAVALFN